MKHTEKLAPIAAASTATTTLVCCLPMGFAVAAATGALSTVIAPLQPWLIAASVVLLAIGMVQLRRKQRACGTHAYSSVIVFGVSAAIVVLVLLFPQTLAGVLADWLP